MNRFLLLLCCIPLLLSAQSDSSFYFVQLADPQFGMYPTGRDFKHERANVSKALQAINRLRPDFVVVCGDLVNSTGEQQQIRAFKESFAALDPTIPLFLVAGNHDVGNKPTNATLDAYRTTFGQDYYSFDRHGVRFVVLNSSLMKYPKSSPSEAQKQDVWFRSVMGQDSAPHNTSQVIVFMHHPLFVDNADETNKYQNIPQKTRREYLRLLVERGVKNVFAGHLHHNASGTFQGLEMSSSGPVGLPLGTDPSGLRIVVVTPTGVKHKYFSLDRVPNSLGDVEFGVK